MKLEIIEVTSSLDPNKDMKPGQAIEHYDKDKKLCLSWCCPRCGKLTSSAKGHKHIYDKETGSLTPSIVHAKKLGGCGYHGFLKNKRFTNV